ncbi:ribonuclease H-like domain-containing protein [Mycena alexandri]|uniref:3'-5' exonuclease n=1 Tax=Mycena alexandri TaxID=1745969 RepID=A0AAD6SG24_9AGAR|nr:ribonuclease H-like domain-containing protein [Mycena alexandri]
MHSAKHALVLAAGVENFTTNDVKTEDGTPAEGPRNLIPYPHGLHSIFYLTTEGAVDNALKGVVDGVVGFDTEFDKRKPTDDEDFIIRIFGEIGGQKKWGILALQLLEMKAKGKAEFRVAWDNIALCVIQLAQGTNVWLINLRAIKAYPKELKRVLCSQSIIKAGVGVTSDLSHLWNDLRTDVQNVVDVGCMARLLLAHKFSHTQYGNLSLQTCTEEILGYSVDKEERLSNWTGELTKQQKIYAAMDAAISLRLYETLAPALDLNLASQPGDIGTYGGKKRPWSVKDCYWFSNNKFQGYT